MEYALIFQDKVIQIEEKPFPVHPSMIWIEADKEKINCGDVYEDGKIKPAPAINQVYAMDPMAALLEALALFVAGTIDKGAVAAAALARLYSSCRTIVCFGF